MEDQLEPSAIVREDVDRSVDWNEGQRRSPGHASHRLCSDVPDDGV